MCVCIHIYRRVCVYMCIHYIAIATMNVVVFTFVCGIYICIWMYMCTYTCIYIYIYVYIYRYMCVYIYLLHRDSNYESLLYREKTFALIMFAISNARVVFTYVFVYVYT